MTSFFSLFSEIHAMNESEAYLGTLIHEIGIDLKSVAHCTQIRCIRQAHFSLEDTLVRRHWDVESILTNITRCRKILMKNPEMLQQNQPFLNETNEIEAENEKLENKTYEN